MAHTIPNEHPPTTFELVVIRNCAILYLPRAEGFMCISESGYLFLNVKSQIAIYICGLLTTSISSGHKPDIFDDLMERYRNNDIKKFISEKPHNLL